MSEISNAKITRFESIDTITSMKKKLSIRVKKILPNIDNNELREIIKLTLKLARVLSVEELKNEFSKSDKDQELFYLKDLNKELLKYLNREQVKEFVNNIEFPIIALADTRRKHKPKKVKIPYLEPPINEEIKVTEIPKSEKKREVQVTQVAVKDKFLSLKSLLSYLKNTKDIIIDTTQKLASALVKSCSNSSQIFKDSVENIFKLINKLRLLRELKFSDLMNRSVSKNKNSITKNLKTKFDDLRYCNFKLGTIMALDCYIPTKTDYRSLSDVLPELSELSYELPLIVFKDERIIDEPYIELKNVVEKEYTIPTPAGYIPKLLFGTVEDSKAIVLCKISGNILGSAKLVAFGKIKSLKIVFEKIELTQAQIEEINLIKELFPRIISENPDRSLNLPIGLLLSESGDNLERLISLNHILVSRVQKISISLTWKPRFFYSKTNAIFATLPDKTISILQNLPFGLCDQFAMYHSIVFKSFVSRGFLLTDIEGENKQKLNTDEGHAYNLVVKKSKIKVVDLTLISKKAELKLKKELEIKLNLRLIKDINILETGLAGVFNHSLWNRISKSDYFEILNKISRLDLSPLEWMNCVSQKFVDEKHYNKYPKIFSPEIVAKNIHELINSLPTLTRGEKTVVKDFIISQFIDIHKGHQELFFNLTNLDLSHISADYLPTIIKFNPKYSLKILTKLDRDSTKNPKFGELLFLVLSEIDLNILKINSRNITGFIRFAINSKNKLPDRFINFIYNKSSFVDFLENIDKYEKNLGIEFLKRYSDVLENHDKLIDFLASNIQVGRIKKIKFFKENTIIKDVNIELVGFIDVNKVKNTSKLYRKINKVIKEYEKMGAPFFSYSSDINNPKTSAGCILKYHLKANDYNIIPLSDFHDLVVACDKAGLIIGSNLWKEYDDRAFLISSGYKSGILSSVYKIDFNSNFCLLIMSPSFILNFFENETDKVTLNSDLMLASIFAAKNSTTISIHFTDPKEKCIFNYFSDIANFLTIYQGNVNVFDLAQKTNAQMNIVLILEQELLKIDNTDKSKVFSSLIALSTVHPEDRINLFPRVVKILRGLELNLDGTLNLNFDDIFKIFSYSPLKRQVFLAKKIIADFSPEDLLSSLLAISLNQSSQNLLFDFKNTDVNRRLYIHSIFSNASIFNYLNSRYFYRISEHKSSQFMDLSLKLAQNVRLERLVSPNGNMDISSSGEYIESSTYHSGNPISSIDWKVSGRSEKLFVKKYEESKHNLRIIINFNLLKDPNYFINSCIHAAAIYIKKRGVNVSITIASSHPIISTDSKITREYGLKPVLDVKSFITEASKLFTIFEFPDEHKGLISTAYGTNLDLSKIDFELALRGLGKPDLEIGESRSLAGVRFIEPYPSFEIQVPESLVGKKRSRKQALKLRSHSLALTSTSELTEVKEI